MICSSSSSMTYTHQSLLACRCCCRRHHRRCLSNGGWSGASVVTLTTYWHWGDGFHLEPKVFPNSRQSDWIGLFLLLLGFTVWTCECLCLSRCVCTFPLWLCANSKPSMNHPRRRWNTHTHIHTRIYFRLHSVCVSKCANWIATFGSASYFQINPENEMNFRFAVWCLHCIEREHGALLCTLFSLCLGGSCSGGGEGINRMIMICEHAAHSSDDFFFTHCYQQKQHRYGASLPPRVCVYIIMNLCSTLFLSNK